jgi:hypothetical protein
MADHTPGPWQAVEGKTTGRMVITPNARTKATRIVAHIGGPDRDANARLIAAAPELLEALVELLGIDRMNENIGWRGPTPSDPNLFQCEFCGSEHDDCTLIDHKYDCAIVEARAAIAKAKGETA